MPLAQEPANLVSSKTVLSFELFVPGVLWGSFELQKHALCARISLKFGVRVASDGRIRWRESHRIARRRSKRAHEFVCCIHV